MRVTLTGRRTCLQVCERASIWARRGNHSRLSGQISMLSPECI
jgi:hypothetical protein